MGNLSVYLGRVIMANEKIGEMKIIMKGNRVITRSDLFKKKQTFHKEQSKLPFEEKIKILVRLQKIANSISHCKEAK